jgi:hypothetical protein
MSVASVSQKGLTNEQKSIFAELVIPDAKPVVFANEHMNDTPEKKQGSSRGKALTQSKIEAGLLGIDKPEDAIAKAITADAPEPIKEKVVYDILSGGAYREGNIVGAAPAQGAATTADFEAMGVTTQAPANNNDRILAMAKQGLDTVQIAKTLGLGVGEVKLVLDLFK